MSGHNKWSTIKHRKGAQDAKRSKIFTKIIKELTVAARVGGGDPDGNPRLRRALDLARSANMPGDNIERAIKKGTGELEGVNYEELVYEGVGPAGSLFVMNVVTDNRNRTASEVRKIFDKHNGQLGASGSAAWAFEEKGVIKLPKDAATEEELFELAVGAGAEDIEADDEQWTITTPRDELDVVRTALENAGKATASAALAQIPKTPKEVSGSDASLLVRLADVLDDHDDIQEVFTDFELSEEALAALT
ncbi:MAG: YebC/PmpR family DNA-binding transcriptional regulator [Myxococcota bacterium]